MTPHAAIEGLSLVEKLQMMEAIWDDLCRDEAQVAVPAWHEQVLKERQDKVDRDEARFISWDDAKKRIRDATS